MKRGLSVLLILLVCFSLANAQSKKKKNPTWFYLEAGGGYGIGMFTNKNASNDALIDADFLNPCTSYGIKVGTNFPFNFGVAYEIGKSNYSQGYTVTNNFDSISHVDKRINISTLDMSFLVRGVTESGSYIEIGPQFSKVVNQPAAFDSYNQFNERFTNLVFGFGGAVYYSQNVDINVGLRITYCMSDLMVNGHYPYAGSDYTVGHYSSYTPTKPFTAVLKVSLNWHIGYFQTAKCDGHTEFLMF